MRWTLRIAALLAVLMAAYAVWPVVGFYRIASAVQARDAAALSARVDFRALRKSLTKQILATYLELTGKEKKLGLLGKSIAMGIGGSMLEPIVAQLINEQTLIDLLSKGKTGDGSGGSIKVPTDLAPFSQSALSSGWQTWWASEYGLGDYYLHLPPGKSVGEQFVVRLSLKEWQWKLSGIDLPELMRMQLAQEIVKQQNEKKDE
jgi:hypothetical protein